MVASLPMIAQEAPAAPAYVIMYDEADGRHVQMGEPGKSVSGYFTSRSLDGQMEYKTMYEADENGYRARGDHLPVAAKAEGRSDDAYIFNYEAPGSHQHYQMGQPGVAVQGSFMYGIRSGPSLNENLKVLDFLHTKFNLYLTGITIQRAKVN